MTKATTTLSQSARAEQLLHHLRQHAVDEAERLGFDVEMTDDEIIFTPKRQDGVETHPLWDDRAVKAAAVGEMVKVDAIGRMVEGWAKPAPEKR